MECVLCGCGSLRITESGRSEYQRNFTYLECGNCALIQCSLHEATSHHYESVEHYRERWEFQKCLDLIDLKENSRVTEAGCGEGYFAEKVETRKLDYTGIDFNAGALQEAKKKCKRGSFLSVSIHDYMRTTNYPLDAFFAFHFVEHFRDPLSLLAPVADKLNNLGYIALSVPSDSRISLRFGRRESWDYPPHHLTRWSDRSIGVLAEKLGLDLVVILEEPLSFKEYIQFSPVEQTANFASLRPLRRLVKAFTRPIDFIFFQFWKRKHSGQAKLAIMRKNHREWPSIISD